MLLSANILPNFLLFDLPFPEGSKSCLEGALPDTPLHERNPSSKVRLPLLHCYLLSLFFTSYANLLTLPAWASKLQGCVASFFNPCEV